MRSSLPLIGCGLLLLVAAVGCGEGEVARLTRELQTAETPARERAAAALGRQTPDDGRVVTALEAAIGDAEPAVRLAAAASLWQLDPLNEAPRAVLIEAIRDAHAPTLKAVGDARDEWAIAALIEQLDNRQPHVRTLSARALGEVGVGSKAVLAALRRHRSDRSAPVRDAATAAFDRLSGGTMNAP